MCRLVRPAINFSTTCEIVGQLLVYSYKSDLSDAIKVAVVPADGLDAEIIGTFQHFNIACLSLDYGADGVIEFSAAEVNDLLEG